MALREREVSALLAKSNRQKVLGRLDPVAGHQFEYNHDDIGNPQDG